MVPVRRYSLQGHAQHEEPLLELRQQQAGALQGYAVTMCRRSPRDWLIGKGVTWESFDPKKGYHYYLLLVGRQEQLWSSSVALAQQLLEHRPAGRRQPGRLPALREAVVDVTGASVPTTRSARCR